jgi:hypothetical protein
LLCLTSGGGRPDRLVHADRAGPGHDRAASIDAGEITDKGYVNQRATLERRSALVDRLYAEPSDPDVIVL